MGNYDIILAIGGVAVVGFAIWFFQPQICKNAPQFPLLCEAEKVEVPLEEIPEPESFSNDFFQDPAAVQEYRYLDVYSQKPVIALDYNVINACLQKCGPQGGPSQLECMAECHSSVLAHQGLF